MFLLDQAFVLLVLMTSWLDGVELESKYDVAQFFAGTARVSRMAKCLGFTPVAMDISYDTSAPPPKTKKKERATYRNQKSAMDLNTSAGFVFLVCNRIALAAGCCLIVFLLNLAQVGNCCSTEMQIRGPPHTLGGMLFNMGPHELRDISKIRIYSYGISGGGQRESCKPYGIPVPRFINTYDHCPIYTHLTPCNEIV